MASETQIPKPLVWAVVAICTIPFLVNLVGVDFGTPGQAFDSLSGREGVELVDAMHQTLAGSFVHTILEWSAFCAAIFTVFLTFLDYAIKKNPMTPIVGIALFFAGTMDAFHTLAADRLIEAVADNRNLIPFTWAICRLFNALITIVGIGILLLDDRWKHKKGQQGLGFLILVTVIFGAIAYSIIYFCATSNNLPNTIFPNSIITRPWDVTPLVLFVFGGLYVYPRFHQKYPNLFSHSVAISAIPNAAAQGYMAFGSTALFDNNFNIAHFLKIIAYLVPLIGLGLEYIQTYRREQETSKALKQSLAVLNSLVARVQECTKLTVAIAASGKQLEATIGEQVSSTKQVTVKAREISAIASQLVQTMNEVERAKSELLLASDSLSERLAAIAANASNINSIIATITDVANQTKLLSVNAAIESARAGEDGKGFTAIAREIRKLAVDTANATETIQQIVAEMEAAVSTGAIEMNRFTSEHIQALTPQFESVNRGMEIQLQGAEQISGAMVELSAGSVQTAEYLLDTNKALEQLHEAVHDLEGEVIQFERDL